MKHIGLILLIFLFACSDNKSGKDGAKGATSTPTSGTVKILVDETFQPILMAEKQAFETVYKSAKLDMQFVPEGEAFSQLMKDSVRIIISARKPTDEEMRIMKNNLQWQPSVNDFAADGIAVIKHPMNPDSALTNLQIKNILTGKIKNWSEVTGKKMGGDDKITIVFDNNKSSLVSFVEQNILKGEKMAANVFAAKGSDDAINYVSQNKNALGFVGFNWMSDENEPKVKEYLTKVNMVALERTDKPGKFVRLLTDNYYYLVTGIYPLSRKMYIINREGGSFLGTGFAAYLSGPDGQLILQKANLFPTRSDFGAYGPNREVNLKEGQLRGGNLVTE